jgi:benzoylformate decarboxylase
MKKTKGIDAMIDIMLHHGVEYVFGISGATEVVFVDALEKQQHIKYILGLNEIVCIGMAEGYARASDKPGFLNLHTGPGLAAAMPFLADAKNAGVPLVVTVGQNDSRLLQYEPQLSGNIIGMAKHQTKWCTEIYHASDIPRRNAPRFQVRHAAADRTYFDFHPAECPPAGFRL